MDLLIDTHALVWLAAADSRIGPNLHDLITDPSTGGYVSAVTAWEFVDLQRRGRFPERVDFAAIVQDFDLELLDLPSGVWTLADTLPMIHRDPVDRMFVAHAIHAIHAGLTVVSADAKIRQYPVPHLW